MKSSRLSGPACRGFALVEVVMAIAAALLIAVMLMIAGGGARSAGMLGQDMAKHREIGAGTYAFALDNQDRLWTFDWRPGVTYNTPWPDINHAGWYVDAAANQAIFIMRSRGYPDMPRPHGWISSMGFSYLVLADYLDKPLPWLTAISAADADRLRWAGTPGCASCYSPCQANHAVHTLGSSFTVTASWFDRSPPGNRVFQAFENHAFYFVPSGTVWGPGQLSNVAFPSRKVALHDVWDRHSGWPVRLFVDQSARMPMLLADGHARVKHTRNANPGWQPNVPADPNPTLVRSLRRTSNCIPGTPGGGQPAQVVEGDLAAGAYRWTRGGLAGRDFAGSEVWDTFEASAPEATSAPGLRLRPANLLQLVSD